MIFQKYVNHINSEIEYLKFIPKNWTIRRLKDFSFIVRGGSPRPAGDPKFYGGKIPFLKVGDLTSNENVYLNTFRYTITEQGLHKTRLVKENTLLLSNSGATLGIPKICTFPTTFNDGIAAFLYTKKINLVFLFFYLKTKTKYFLENSAMGQGQPNLNTQIIGNTFISLPSEDIQIKIINYLELQTKQIDGEIELLEQKIKNYKELKEILINKTILLGINENVELKPTNIEGINCIPKYWEIKRLKDIGYLYSGLNGKNSNDFNQKDNILNKPFIPFTNIANNKYLDNRDFKQVIINKGDNQNKVKQNDLFFLMSSEGYEDIGKSSLLIDTVGEVYLNSFCKGFRITEKEVFAKYINYLLLSKSFRKLIIIQGKGFTRINLKMDKIQSLPVILPPKDEQIEIANYLDEKTLKIDTIIETIEEKIKVLKEFRKTLINDVVTGKVKVEDE